MVRRSRVEQQEHNRRLVLAAALEEFTERGFRAAKIDDIAERAGLTRGAVYSNFPGKRALYFSVLADLAERPTEPVPAGTDVREALAAFARARLAGLPLTVGDQHRLGADLVPEILAQEPSRQAYAQLMKVSALLLGLALERLRPYAGRLVPLAETVLTTLHGAEQLTSAAPGFVEPFDVVRACAQLAGLDLAGGWPPAHLDFAPPARPADDPWRPPPALDAVTDAPAPLGEDGVVLVLGLHRLEAVEEAVRAGGAPVTAVLVSGRPAELGPLARLVVADLCRCLRQAFPSKAWPRLRLVHDPSGEVARAAGVTAVSDLTETALQVRSNRITGRAEGRGACHSVAAR
ncbi:TetR/AcrR family transcriptional regulator [Actinomadura kijaniata]|uniref:TetR/AcrR family transcriptional regulator n=1 Tax=Actinomadura kijaniata TaxID=46161 RepID=UPI0008323631|nr:TetR/AcrR family transcriptional regulator [Actinomadura kijaniata]